MSSLKDKLKKSVLIPVAAVSITTPIYAGEIVSSNSVREVKTRFEILDIEKFVFLSTNQSFRRKYFRDIPSIRNDYHMSETTFNAIVSINLEILEKVISDHNWDDLDGMTDGCHTKSSHTDNHTNVYGEGSYVNNHTDSHEKGSTCRDDFLWEKLLHDYSDVVAGSSSVLKSIGYGVN